MKKGGKKSTIMKPKTRKELRKEKRKLKKVRKQAYHEKKRKGSAVEEQTQPEPGKFVKIVKDEPVSSQTNNDVDPTARIKKEKQVQAQLERQMQKQRAKQMLQANLEEDKNIRRLEKQLKLNKRKSKSVPKSFASDGLDYLLEICGGEGLKDALTAEQEFEEGNEDFEEDFALMSGRTVKELKKKRKRNEDESDDDVDEEDDSDTDILSDKKVKFDKNLHFDDDEEEEEDEEDEEMSNEDQVGDESEEDLDLEDEEVDEDEGVVDEDEEEVDEDEEEVDEDEELDEDEEVDEEEEVDEGEEDFEDAVSPKDKSSSKAAYEDIYGRLHDSEGNIIPESAPSSSKYIPPALRAKSSSASITDKKRIEQLARLKRQLKGLLNRLAESNMHNISNQMETLYMSNSRNDMNETLTSLILEAVASNIQTPERLLLEHVVLIAVLAANVGIEIGAHFLQTTVKKFDESINGLTPMEDKTLDNLINVLGQLYNFKIFDSQLLYQLLSRLSEKFEEKHVDCILSVLKSVGFTLRKDDPAALKELIVNLQKKANEMGEELKQNARVKFLLDILLAIKNNNVQKIPNYDTSYSEHLKKLMKGFVRKGNYVTPLNIALDDLLKADERGKWWVVGSAWTGKTETETEKLQTSTFSTKLLELAKKQRMNTDTRRSIFCVIMSSEDYLDAFEKILRLGLKQQQEREIIHVLLHCCLQEKSYNPYYSVLAQKFCEHDRKFQLTIKYSVWDKLKALTDCAPAQISNLAKLLTHLFLENGLPISTLKVVQFSELDKLTLRFMRQILLGVLLCDDVEQCQNVFEKVAQSDKLKMFRESLRLFIHHFLLRNVRNNQLVDSQKSLLDERAKLIERILGKKKI